MFDVTSLNLVLKIVSSLPMMASRYWVRIDLGQSSLKFTNAAPKMG